MLYNISDIPMISSDIIIVWVDLSGLWNLNADYSVVCEYIHMQGLSIPGSCLFIMFNAVIKITNGFITNTSSQSGGVAVLSSFRFLDQ